MDQSAWEAEVAEQLPLLVVVAEMQQLLQRPPVVVVAELEEQRQQAPVLRPWGHRLPEPHR